MSALRFIALGVAVPWVVALACAAASAGPLFTAGEQVPSDAIVLFDGGDLSKWVRCGNDEPAAWKVENGYMTAGGGDICTREKFTDCQLHVEFWLPLMSDAQGQGRANSGVFLMGWNYEVQVLDSYGQQSGTGDCGALYGTVPPMVNASRPAQTWQTYDIFFRAPRFDADGKKTANARITVLHNGVLIHDCVEIPHPTTGAGREEPREPGPIELQDHGNPVRFRNVWVRKLN